VGKLGTELGYDVGKLLDGTVDGVELLLKGTEDP